MIILYFIFTFLYLHMHVQMYNDPTEILDLSHYENWYRIQYNKIKLKNILELKTEKNENSDPSSTNSFLLSPKFGSLPLSLPQPVTFIGRYDIFSAIFALSFCLNPFCFFFSFFILFDSILAHFLPQSSSLLYKLFLFMF